MAVRLATIHQIARPVRAGRARLLAACNASGLTQAELGARIGTTDRGVRRLQRANRKRPDRLDLLDAAEAAIATKKAA